MKTCFSVKKAIKKAVALHCKEFDVRYNLPTGACIRINSPPNDFTFRSSYICVKDAAGRYVTRDCYGKIEYDINFNWANIGIRLRRPFWKWLLGIQ